MRPTQDCQNWPVRPVLAVSPSAVIPSNVRVDTPLDWQVFTAVPVDLLPVFQVISFQWKHNILGRILFQNDASNGKITAFILPTCITIDKNVYEVYVWIAIAKSLMSELSTKDSTFFSQNSHCTRLHTERWGDAFWKCSHTNVLRLLLPRLSCFRS
jgi:hypothetical protein